MGLQEDMAGPSQGDMECLKILRPRMYAYKLVSAHFLFAESDLLGFAIGNELVPLSGYVDLPERRSCHCDCLGHLRSLETQALSRRRVEPGLVEGGGVPQCHRQQPLVPPPGMESLRLRPRPP